MHTRTVNNFEEYVGFIADHVSENWRGYKREAPDRLRLENIFGEPVTYPVMVGVQWERGDESGMSIPKVGFVAMEPAIHSFKK